MSMGNFNYDAKGNLCSGVATFLVILMSISIHNHISSVDIYNHAMALQPHCRMQ